MAKPFTKRIGTTKIDVLDRKCMTAINRVINVFMDKTWAKTMEKTDIDSLVNITKLIKNLVKEEKQTVKESGDAELEKAAGLNESK
jgi:hypothetical protein